MKMEEDTAIQIDKTGSIYVAMMVDNVENTGTIDDVTLVPNMTVNILLVSCPRKKEMVIIFADHPTNLKQGMVSIVQKSTRKVVAR